MSHLQTLFAVLGSVVSGLTFFVWWDGTPRGIRAAARRAERRAARDKAEWRARG